MMELTKPDLDNLQALIRRAPIKGEEAEAVAVLLLKLRTLASQSTVIAPEKKDDPSDHS